MVVVEPDASTRVFVLEECGGVVLSISVLGPVAWQDRSTGRCTDADAGNLPDKYLEGKAQDLNVRGVVPERDEDEACSGVRGALK